MLLQRGLELHRLEAFVHGDEMLILDDPEDEAHGMGLGADAMFGDDQGADSESDVEMLVMGSNLEDDVGQAIAARVSPHLHRRPLSLTFAPPLLLLPSLPRDGRDGVRRQRGV